MMLTLDEPLALDVAVLPTTLLGGDSDGIVAAQADEQLDPEALLSRCRLKYAQFHCLSSVVALEAMASISLATALTGTRIGVITAGGPHHVQNAWNSTQRVLEKGPGFITPAEFPHTIMNSFPTTLASALGARAFAFSVGDSAISLYEAVYRAAQLISAAHAEHVIVAAVSGAEPVLTGLYKDLGRCVFDGTHAICIHVGKSRVTDQGFLLQSAYISTASEEEYSTRVEAAIEDVHYRAVTSLSLRMSDDAEGRRGERACLFDQTECLTPLKDGLRLARIHSGEPVFLALKADGKLCGFRVIHRSLHTATMGISKNKPNQPQ